MAFLIDLFRRKPRPLREEVLGLISRLSEPLSGAEEREGWDIELKQKWYAFFLSLDNQLAAGMEPSVIDSRGYISTARAMDFDGVSRTELCTLAARIDVRINRGDRYT
ncbi:MAG: hypothetical protein U1D69_01955 [Polynucleobacter sp.]|nr:hypothetical protein [Polynucleobacter sp.]